MKWLVRLLQLGAILTLTLGFGAVACVAVIFIATGEGPLTATRDALAQLSLSRRADDLNTPLTEDGQPVRFVVESGTSTRRIAENLFLEGLIRDVDLFVDYTVANDIDVQLEAGTYFLSSSLNIPEIAELLTDSNSSNIPFRILEGWRIEEIAAAVDQNGLFGFTGEEFLAVVGPNAEVPRVFRAYVDLPPGASLEGFMYPDTYILPPSITAEGLRDTLLDTFMERVTVEMVNDARAQDLTMYDIVTLASIAEREAVHSIEFTAIMSVYRNRLDAGMTLGADPTVQYALNGQRGRWWANITRADYQGVDSPYNTYLYEGLPPGPIASPGIQAIEAAIYPMDSDYLYFRAECSRSGYHEFAVTYEQHLQNGCGG
jgi:UPF0755 protein